MNFKQTLLTTAIITFTSIGIAQAQNAGGKTGDKGSGEMTTPSQDKGTMGKPKAMGESRANVKAEAIAATASGAVAKGEQSTPNQGKKPMRSMTSEKSREEVKAEAAAANKAGNKPATQESVKDQNKGGGAALKP